MSGSHTFPAVVEVKSGTRVLSRDDWRFAAEAHQRRLTTFVDAHLKRRSRGEKHPVYDFLFEYYSFKPSHLMRWSPGVGAILQDAPEYATWKEMEVVEQGVMLNARRFPAHRVEALLEILELLQSTAERQPFHGCNGLHEWAMVYRSEEIRHSQVPLRLPLEAVAELVDAQSVRCSHYDAFRFFTPAARPLNVLQPEHSTRVTLEQRGCIHVNMDLYKWAYKFYPWISSDVIADAFELAVAAREMDMRASPYDFSEQGFAPIRIETQEGRLEYVRHQKSLAERAQPIRLRLMGEYERLIEAAQI